MPALFGEFSSSLVQNGIVLLVIGEVLLAGVIILVFVKQRRIQADLKVFFTGKEAKNLEKVLLDQLKEVQELDQEIQELFGISNQLRDLCLKSLHKTSVIRFNPFKEVGGNQSFSVVLLDALFVLGEFLEGLRLLCVGKANVLLRVPDFLCES